MDKPSVAYIYQHAKWVVDSKGSYRYWFEYDEEWFDAVYEQAANLMEVIEYLVSKGLIDASDLDLPETSKETPSSEVADDDEGVEHDLNSDTAATSDAGSGEQQPVEAPPVAVFQMSFPENWNTKSQYKDDMRTLVATAMTSAAQGTPIGEEALETIFSWFTTTPKIPNLTDILKNDGTLHQGACLTADMVLSMLDKINGEGSAGASWHVLSLLNSLSPVHKFVPKAP